MNLFSSMKQWISPLMLMLGSDFVQASLGAAHWQEGMSSPGSMVITPESAFMFFLTYLAGVGCQYIFKKRYLKKYQTTLETWVMGIWWMFPINALLILLI